MIFLSIALVVVGIYLLAIASDKFVLGSSRLATTWRVPPVVIGTVIIGFGTGMPELLTSTLAATEGNLDLAVGGIIGSNLANLTLVLGLVSVIAAPKVIPSVLRREAPIALLSVVLFAFLIQNGLSILDGVLLLVFFLLFVALVFHSTRKERNRAQLSPDDDEYLHEIEEYVEEEEETSLDEVVASKASRDVARTIIGLLGTLLGAQLLVHGAIDIADELNISGGFVGVTIVAIGTSLPELVTSIQAARRQELSLVIGNVLGSNIFNCLAVGGTVAIAGPGQVTDANLVVNGALMMVTISVVSTVFFVTGKAITKVEGIILLCSYALFMPFLA